MLRLQPTPLFNRLKTGCRPFVEVWCGNNRIFTTQRDYEMIRFADLNTCDIYCNRSVEHLKRLKMHQSIFR
jgi:hypothetical protein